MTILWILLLLLAAYGTGAPVVRWLIGRGGGDDGSPLSGRIISVWIGAGTLGLVALIGNALGMLPRPVAVSLLPLVALAGAWQLWQDRRSFTITALRWEDWLGLAVVVSLYAWLAGWSWVPWLHVDSYAYHFTTPKQWLMEGRLRAVPFEAHANFYQLWSAWIFWGIALEPDNFLLPRQQVTLALLSIAVLLALEIRRCTGGRVAAWVAAAGWMITLEAFETCVTDYMDMVMAGMVLISALAMMWALECGDDRTRRRHLVLSGVAAGFAIGLKITGLAIGFAMGLALLVGLRRMRLSVREFVLCATCFGATALGLWLPWAIKNMVITGNPFYPFLLGVFGAGNDYLQVAQDFQRFYKPDPSLGFDLMGKLRELNLFRLNVQYLDPNRIIAASLLVGLVSCLYKSPSRSGRTMLFILAAALLPLAYYLPANRFRLAPLVVIYLSLAVEFSIMASAAAARWGRGVRLLLFGGFLLLAKDRLIMAQQERLPVFVGEHDRVPFRFYPNIASIRATSEELYWGTDAVRWLEKNLPQDQRVLVTSNIPLSAMADVRVLSNVHIHGETVLAILTEDQGLDCAALVERLRGWEIGAVYTEENLDRNPALQELHDQWLEPILSGGGFTLYRLKEGNR